jgi:hypothetical protein
MRALIILLAATSITTNATAQPGNQDNPAVQSVTPKHVPTASDLEAERFRVAAEVKQKAWDSKTKAAVSGICKGC